MNDAFDARQGAGPVDGDRGGVSPMRRCWVLISGIVSLGRLEAPPQSELEMVENERHALEMALEEVTIIIGHCRSRWC